MSTYYRADAPKKPVNLTLNADLLAVGKTLGLNISGLAEEALAQAVRAHMEAAWLRENAAAIALYNERVLESGVFGDEFRSF